MRRHGGDGDEQQPGMPRVLVVIALVLTGTPLLRFTTSWVAMTDFIHQGLLAIVGIGLFASCAAYVRVSRWLQRRRGGRKRYYLPITGPTIIAIVIAVLIWRPWAG